MLNLVDYFGGTMLIFALAMFELVAIFWIYGEIIKIFKYTFFIYKYFYCFLGIENFCWDLEYMTGRKASLYWRFCWFFITPVFMTFIFIYSMSNLEPLKYSGWEYPSYLTCKYTVIYIICFISICYI